MPQHRSPSPRLNLGRLKKQQQQVRDTETHAASTSSPRSHGSPNSSASPNGETPVHGGGGVQTPLSSFRLGGMLSQRRQSRFGRIGSMLFRPDRRESVRFDQAPHHRKLVPVPEDLTHDEVHQVEEDFARFGPISSQLELTEFLATIGENISEEELLVLLKRIVSERSAEEAAATAALATARSRDSNNIGETSARGISRPSIMAPHPQQTPTQTQRTSIQPMSSSQSMQLSDGDDDSTSTPISNHQRRPHQTGSVAAAGHTTSTNRELKVILKKRFLRPFFALEDTLVLLRHIKAGVLLNRLSLDEAKEVFDALCADGLGVIDAAEFMRITKTFSLKLEVEQFVRDVDEDGSGQIELAEFRALLGRVSGGGGRSLAQSFATIHPHQRGGGGVPPARRKADDSDEDDFLENSANGGGALEKMGNNFSSVQYDGVSMVGSVVFGAEGSVDDQHTYAGGVGGGGQSHALSSPQDIVMGGGDLHGSMLITVPSAQATSATATQPVANNGNGGMGATTTTGWLTRSPTLASLQQQSQQQQQGDASSILDAHLRQIRRDLVNADADPLAGIEAAKPLASYIALQQRHVLAPMKVRMTRQQQKKENSAKDLRASPNRGGGGRVVRQQPPRRLAPVESHNHPSGVLLVAESSSATTPIKHVLSNSVPRDHVSPSPGSHLPPMLRPNRQPFHVAEGVFPEWRESYFQHMRPM
ncbi:Hypothetical protein, putative [Bodo saltans]|uniref:EF-hand domain-containing protein n=1 Tax=Bodo saltans TaxID=75058 RepID=A0A0S4J0U5_BODSA|nr:Hypothetical protein, putative [Bodo saltans]|eukprot:CUG78664.1 Hypothetical protein, putative [Bodo saltans]